MEFSPLVGLANRMVPMATACRLAGLAVPDVYRDSGSKMYCPWGDFNHPDGGREPAFRVYPDHAWCFACREHYKPARLCAELWDVSPEQAAARLLDAVGYKPADYAHHWQEVVRPPELDREAVAQALRNFCGSLAGQDYLAHPGVAEYMSRCLGFLTQVKNEAEAAQWLQLAKQVMQEVLRRTAHAH